MPFQKIQSSDRVVNMLQTNISNVLNPLLINLLIGFGGNIVTQTLVTGSNVVNHGLGRLQVGWQPVDQNAEANFYRIGSFNTTSMTIVSSADVTASFYCF
jgi:hypothetical protein